jgi:ribose transport system ATP-binding protein
MAPPILELKEIRKQFPGVVALDDVRLSVNAAEVHALIGENGAGKSTLMKILGGVHQADAGQILVDGRPVEIRSVTDAGRLGIAFIHQELNVLDNLDVAANVYMGREPTWGGPLKLIDRRRIVEDSRRHLERLGLEIDPRRPLLSLSLAQQQMVEIAKALSQDARVIIMDEPTSCLTLSETDKLLATVADLRDQGVSIIYISHRLGEIERCADRLTALRDGRNAGNLERGEIAHDAMVQLMIGRKLEDLYVTGKPSEKQGSLQVRGLKTREHSRHAVDFEVRRGEILGFAGLVGAGRTEVARAIFGVEPALEGEILLDEAPLTIRSAHDGIRAGIFLVPEDRRQLGLITEMNIRENVTLPSMREHSRSGLIRFGAERETARACSERLRVKTPTVETRASNLSGGNQQKVVLAKWVARKPNMIIFDEPTRGIDVGAKAEIYQLMRELADSGVAIMMISSDMEEVIGVSDRIAVMHEGRMMDVLERSAFSEEAIMQLAVGRAGELREAG